MLLTILQVGTYTVASERLIIDHGDSVTYLDINTEYCHNFLRF